MNELLPHHRFYPPDTDLDMHGGPKVKNPALKFIADLSNSLHPPNFCWAIVETGSSKSVVLACERYNNNQQEIANSRLKELNRDSKPGHSFTLIHLEPNQPYPYPLNSAWGGSRIQANNMTHCVNDGMTCG